MSPLTITGSGLTISGSGLTISGVGTAAAAGGGGGGGGGSLSISITSSSFSNGATIGGAYYITGGNCHPNAANTSPQISWTVSGSTAGASGIRCLCIDIDSGDNFVHWFVSDIPVESGSISENGSWPSGSTVNANDWDGVLTSRSNGWGGPCPPSQHTYEITFDILDSNGDSLATSNTLSFEAS